MSPAPACIRGPISGKNSLAIVIALGPANLNCLACNRHAERKSSVFGKYQYRNL